MQHENEEPRYGIFYYCEIKRYASMQMDGFNLAKVATWLIATSLECSIFETILKKESACSREA